MVAPIRFIAAMGLAVLSAASAASSQDTTRVEVGDFLLHRSVDFFTDSITYSWARVGDELLGGVARMLAAAADREFVGYKTLELKCEEGPLQVILHTDRGSLPLPDTLAPVQLRFGTNPPEAPSQWRYRLLGLSESRSFLMPDSLVRGFVEGARPATRVRVRLGPYNNPTGMVPREELEFSLRGFTRSLELLNCPSP